jgi:hypothetical protein
LLVPIGKRRQKQNNSHQKRRLGRYLRQHKATRKDTAVHASLSFFTCQRTSPQNMVRKTKPGQNTSAPVIKPAAEPLVRESVSAAAPGSSTAMNPI